MEEALIKMLIVNYRKIRMEQINKNGEADKNN
jgi:hypothetical protein